MAIQQLMQQSNTKSFLFPPPHFLNPTKKRSCEGKEEQSLCHLIRVVFPLCCCCGGGRRINPAHNMDVNVFIFSTPSPRKHIVVVVVFVNRIVVTHVSTSWIMFGEGPTLRERMVLEPQRSHRVGSGADKVQEGDNRIQGLHPCSRLWLQAKVRETPAYIKI